MEAGDLERARSLRSVWWRVGLAWLSLAAAGWRLAASARPAAAFQAATPTPTLPAPGMPRPAGDRLAEPTLPAAPSQADLGAQAFWLHCMPCHGDRGQGLTPEFRAQYPPEDRNCWESGCHGARPYEDGFTLPTAIPPVIGSPALVRFADAQALFAFVRAAMPWHDPGSLPEETYWQVVAYLARENGRLPESVLLGPESAAALGLTSGAATPTAPAPEQPASNRDPRWAVVLLVGAAGLLATAGGLAWLARKAGRTASPG